MQQYKYLGTVLDSKLSFEEQTNAVCSKLRQRKHFLRKLRSFNVNSTFVKLFYLCFVESVLTFSFICWFSLLNVKNQNCLRSIIKECGKIIGTQCNDIADLFKSRSVKKAQRILADSSHPLHSEFKLLPSGRRYAVPSGNTNRFRNSFIPRVIELFNKL